MKLFVIFVICAALGYRNAATGFQFSKCQRNSPDLSQCLIKSVEEVLPYIKDGVPELKIPRLDPFKMRLVKLDAQKAGLTLKGEASNIVAYGASNIEIKSLKVDIDNLMMEVHVYFPRLDVTADYDCQRSKLYLFSINGSGQFKGTFNGVEAVLKGQGHKINRDGEEYVQVDKLESKIRIANSILHIEPDVKTRTTKAVTKFVNRSPAMIMKLVTPVINRASAPIIMKYVNKVAAVLPLNKLLI